jgi:tRNA-Thr(GGU) m(6)t(6)A37 methyltransferase TsaA
VECAIFYDNSMNTGSQFPSLTVTPIGIIRTPYTDRYAAPRQPGVAEQQVEAYIDLYAGHNFEQALADLEGFEKIWVLYWFHRNTTWKPKVLPPRSGRIKRGVFATRSPHRPNPLGLSAITLLGIEGRRLYIHNPDMLDGTPVLDLKPYIPYADAFPDARAGWTDNVWQQQYDVHWTETALARHLHLLQKFTIDLRSSVEPVLRNDPFPHPYRRIEQREDGSLIMAFQSWRILFRMEATRVVIEDIQSGYSQSAVAEAAPGTLHDQEAHEDFYRTRLLP